LVDLGQIMILAGQPEDRNVLATAGLGSVLRFTNGSCGLEEGEKRTSEKSYLLPGDHGGGALPETLDVGEDGLTRCKGSGLRAKSVCEERPVRWVQGG
jgi:hypothetical protein